MFFSWNSQHLIAFNTRKSMKTRWKSGQNQNWRKRFFFGNYLSFLIASSIFAASAPENRSTSSPFFKKTNVGMAETSYRPMAKSISWSTSTFSTTICDLNWFAKLSKCGAIFLHGTHQWAKKSTTTNLLPAFLTCSSKSSSLSTWWTASDVGFGGFKLSLSPWKYVRLKWFETILDLKKFPHWKITRFKQSDRTDLRMQRS